MQQKRHIQRKKRKIAPIQIIRAVIQLAAFLLIPGLFITFFSAIGDIYQSILHGTFVFAEQAVNILVVVALFLITFIWGRFFCGFLCSFGAMQDLLWFFGKRIPLHPVIPQKIDRVLKYFKYVVLLFVVVGVWTLGIPGDSVWSPWTVFGMYASPLKGFPTQMMFLSVGGALLLAIIIGSLFIERFFCKYFCPLGALFTLASHFRIFKLRRDADKCSGRCRVCTRKCSMSIPLYQHECINSGECINCMKCTTACAVGNMKVQPVPAVSGTLAAVALAGVSFAGTLPPAQTEVVSATAPNQITSTVAPGKFKNGTYTGSAASYRGTIDVTVLVTNGNISEITVTSAGDDREYLSKAENQVIPAIIKAQDTDVDTVSGATYSSRGIINAVENALGDQLMHATTSPVTTVQPTEEETEPTTNELEFEDSASQEETEAVEKENEDEDEATQSSQSQSEESAASNGSFTDGEYSGSGSGFRGTTNVTVTVENGAISDITVISYDDDYPFFSSAESGVIDEILSAQSIDVDTVSGATFSSNSIIEAVANALGLDFSNPNSSMGGGHDH